MTHAEAGRLGAIKRRENLIKRFNENPNACRYCNKPLLLREREQPSWVLKRRFCNNRCSASFNNRLREPRQSFCKNDCGNRVKVSGRIFCSLKCQHRYEYLDTIRKWKAGEISGGTEDGYKTHKAIRRYILERSNYCCEQCGWIGINPVSGKSTVVVDHADGNAGNNREENLRALCPNCHSLTPTFGAVNRGNGRPNRRARDKKYFIAVTAA
jgi:5-methylcytosine-specific restriction endonuclease McrA